IPVPSGQPVPVRQRASDTSLLRRLEAAADRIQRLEAENQQLREALALALGDRRAGNVLGSAPDYRRADSYTQPRTGECVLGRPAVSSAAPKSHMSDVRGPHST